jgi:Uri superfamily endonuclease
MKSQPGTYTLVLLSTKAAPMRVGKLGILQLQPGFYVYVGSAHGPGGLHARLAHHLEPTGRPHWHIDYLRAHTKPQEVWFCYDGIRWECPWADCFRRMRGASVPLKGFGSSDCQCGSHLFFFSSQPAKAAFARMLRSFNHTHPPVLVHIVSAPSPYHLHQYP